MDAVEEPMIITSAHDVMKALRDVAMELKYKVNLSMKGFQRMSNKVAKAVEEKGIGLIPRSAIEVLHHAPEDPAMKAMMEDLIEIQRRYIGAANVIDIMSEDEQEQQAIAKSIADGQKKLPTALTTEPRMKAPPEHLLKKVSVEKVQAAATESLLISDTTQVKGETEGAVVGKEGNIDEGKQESQETVVQEPEAEIGEVQENNAGKENTAAEGDQGGEGSYRTSKEH